MANDDKPNPGSRDALDQGCLCPIIDNHHGRGRPNGDYVTMVNCPIHGFVAKHVDE